MPIAQKLPFSNGSWHQKKKYGNKQQDSLLILTIISATKILMSFAKKWCNPANS